ncbi:hypothetical protein Tco_0854726 [Tanacetum coccineum]
MASQDTRLSKFEVDFKQQQSEMTNKIDTVLKAITDRIAGELPNDTVKNLKLSTSLVLSARSYPNIDPQCSSHPFTSINAIKAHSKEANIFQTSLLRPGMEIEAQQPKDTELTLEDEFQDLHLNLSVLEVLAHALIYNAILDKYVESLELGKNGSAFVQGEVPAKMEDPGLFTPPYRLGDLKPFDTLADLGSCDKPPKDEDGAWHAKIRLIDPDGDDLPKPYSQSPQLESSPKEKVQGKSSTWTTSTTLDV